MVKLVILVSAFLVLLINHETSAGQMQSDCAISGCHCYQSGKTNASIEILCNGDWKSSNESRAAFKIDYARLKNVVITRLFIENFTLQELLPNIFNDLNINIIEFQNCWFDKVTDKSFAGIRGLQRFESNACQYDDISMDFLSPLAQSLKHLAFKFNYFTKRITNKKTWPDWIGTVTKKLNNIETLHFEA